MFIPVFAIVKEFDASPSSIGITYGCRMEVWATRIIGDIPFCILNAFRVSLTVITPKLCCLRRVLYFNREILHVACILAVFLIIVTSVLMYLFRPRGKDVENLDDLTDFESISSTMVLSVLMLTGQGGPEGQLPWYTQIMVLLTGLFSIAMFAIPASMLTVRILPSDFVALEMRRKKLSAFFLDNANKMSVLLVGF